MTKKQIRFVDEYMIDLNATQAAIRTGYSEKTAYSQGQRLLKNDEIKAEIERRTKESGVEKIITAKQIMEYLSRVANDEETEDVVLPTGDIIQKRVKASDRIKAAETMAKRYALFVDRSEVQVDTSSKLSDIIGQLNGGE